MNALSYIGSGTNKDLKIASEDKVFILDNKESCFVDNKKIIECKTNLDSIIVDVDELKRMYD